MKNKARERRQALARRVAPKVVALREKMEQSFDIREQILDLRSERRDVQMKTEQKLADLLRELAISSGKNQILATEEELVHMRAKLGMEKGYCKHSCFVFPLEGIR